ncbi:MAG TPA: copper resistance CopC family protein [Gammaproteobacteria bacterium]|nr:copper resistance CopC family protein [Gammaproteobacteria bacterium]
MQITRTLALGFVLLSGIAFAHTQLSSSAPADGATLTTAPESINLAFSTDVRLTALSLVDAAGASYELGALPTATQRAFSITPARLPAGSYSIGWRAVGADTHVISGEIHFSIAAN